jgi:hypothetical protein
MFTILFSYENTNQAAAKTVHPFPVCEGAIATIKFLYRLNTLERCQRVGRTISISTAGTDRLVA